MAADTNSPLLQLLLQGTGNNNNAWGENLNTSALLLLEQAIAGVSTIAVTGGTIILSNDQARAASIILTGNLTSNQVIVVPARTKKWSFVNRCTGAFQVIVQTNGGTQRNAPLGTTTNIICDGANVVREDQAKVGEYFFHGGSTPPAGAIECSGGTGMRAGLVDLFAAIGTTHGAGNGVTTFGLPNAYDTARFIRSRSNTYAAGQLLTNTNKIHTHTGSGTTGNENSSHYHNVNGVTQNEGTTHTHSGSGTTGFQSTAHYHNGSGTTGNSNQSLSHSHQYLACTQPQAGQPGGQWGMPTGFGTGTTSPSDVPAHNHSFSFATGYESDNHYHGFSLSTGGQSATHTHVFGAGSDYQSDPHAHAYSFTTSNGSGDNSEARPECIVGILCIRI